VIRGWKSGQSCCLEYEVSFDAYALAQSGGTFLASETLAIPAKNVSNPHEARAPTPDKAVFGCSHVRQQRFRS